MSSKRYSKKKLAIFRQGIEKKLMDVQEDIGDIKDNLDQDNDGRSNLAQDSVYSVHWKM